MKIHKKILEKRSYERGMERETNEKLERGIGERWREKKWERKIEARKVTPSLSPIPPYLL